LHGHMRGSDMICNTALYLFCNIYIYIHIYIICTVLYGVNVNTARGTVLHG
jgi:hypothetical protein